MIRPMNIIKYEFFYVCISFSPVVNIVSRVNSTLVYPTKAKLAAK